MAYFKWLIAGLIGGAIGGAIWVALGYYGNVEVGWIAWGIGFLAGFAVRMAAGEAEGVGPGMAALASAVAIVALSKFLVVTLSLNAALAGAQENASPPTAEQTIGMMAFELGTEKEAAGEVIDWPADAAVYEDEIVENDYPPELWQAAHEKWDALTPAEQQAEQQAEQDRQIAEQKVVMDQFVGQIRDQAFKASFSPFDLLWFGLAAFTAFKLGSGAVGNE